MVLPPPLLVHLPLLAAAVTAVTAEPEPVPGHSGLVWTLVGTGVALIIIGICFLVRKTVYAVLNVVLVILSALILIVAVLGEPLGIYMRIHRWWVGSDKEAPEGQPATPPAGTTATPVPGGGDQPTTDHGR